MQGNAVSQKSEVKEHPMLFMGEMVRATLDGRKTQTRRVINPQPHFIIKDGSQCCPYWLWIKGKRRAAWTENGDKTLILHQCKYQVGDRLWVKEAWRYEGETHKGCPYCCSIEEADKHIATVVHYKADDEHKTIAGRFKTTKSYCREGYLPSIHMPRWASRILLEVTEIRVQRVQDISEEDAKAEGCQPEVVRSYGLMNTGTWMDYPLYKAGYKTLWDSINAKRGFGWDVNPWVWAITFNG